MAQLRVESGERILRVGSPTSPGGSRQSPLRRTFRIGSRKSLNVLAAVAISLVIILLASSRLQSWPTLDGPYYHHNPLASPSALPDHAQSPVVVDGDDIIIGIGAKVTQVPSHGDAEKEKQQQESRPSVVPTFPTEHPAIPTPSIPPTPPAAPSATAAATAPAERDPECANFPDTSDILVVMKTGASEAYGRLPTQLLTTLRCLPRDDMLVFSDMAQTVAGVEVLDALEGVAPEARDANPDFDLWRRQRACAVDQASCNKAADASAVASAGWDLDKYKNNHMAARAWALRPGRDWYVFVDADSYVLWDNLVGWLRSLRADRQHYIGSVAYVNDFPFAHGGSGYVLSRATMETFADKWPAISHKYDVETKQHCCGDYMFSRAIQEATGTDVTNVWPTINGEKPFTLPFGPTHWCHPIVTMHHMNSEEINQVWEWEQALLYNASTAPPASASSPGSNWALPSQQRDQRPVLMKDLYYQFAAPAIRQEQTREDWDNLSNDRLYLDPAREWEEWEHGREPDRARLSEAEQAAHASARECALACEEAPTEDCFQWAWREGYCAFSRSIKLGAPIKRPEGSAGTTSGWALDKIRAWEWEQEQLECERLLWPKIQP